MTVRTFFLTYVLFTVSAATLADTRSCLAGGRNDSRSRNWICEIPRYGIYRDHLCRAWGTNRSDAERNFRSKCARGESFVEPDCYALEDRWPH